MDRLEDHSILILGYGREGRSTHRYLVRKGSRARIGVADRSAATDVVAPATIHVGDHYLDHLKDYDVIVRSPGVPHRLPDLVAATQRGQRITTHLNLFFSECPGATVGVTGTKGKSTTSALIAHIAKAAYRDVRLVGNIGHPALDSLEGSDKETLFVVELSSQQLVDLSHSPHIAVVLALVPEHLDFHGTFDDYVAAKTNIVLYQTTGDVVVFNPEHETAERIASHSKARRRIFSVAARSDAVCSLKGDSLLLRRGESLIDLVKRDELPLLGPGNLENVMAAATVAVELSVPVGDIQQRIRSFHPLDHRLELVGQVRGIRFYNDSLATVPQATIHALQALGPDVATLIAGGYDRGLDYSELGRYVAETRVRTLILFPSTGARISDEVVKAAGDHPPAAHFVASMEEAVRLAIDVTAPGKICLLSPASASFGMFRDYEDRGEQFRSGVRRYSEEHRCLP